MNKDAKLIAEAYNKIEEEPRPYITGANTIVWKLSNGHKHRQDGPAVERVLGPDEWFCNDNRHREGAPAVQYKDGSFVWYFRDKMHRLHEPALYYKGEKKEWHWHGMLHRTDGPAKIVYHHDTVDPDVPDNIMHQEWYIMGEQCTEQQFKNAMFPERFAKTNPDIHNILP